jgi:hypothetical protein
MLTEVTPTGAVQVHDPGGLLYVNVSSVYTPLVVSVQVRPPPDVHAEINWNEAVSIMLPFIVKI